MEAADPTTAGGELVVLLAGEALIKAGCVDEKSGGSAQSMVDAIKEEGVSSDFNPLGSAGDVPRDPSRGDVAAEAARDPSRQRLKIDGGGAAWKADGPCVTALHFPAASPTAPTVVYFHGNADQLGWGAAYIGRALHDHYGVGFYGIEYPGYATSKGLKVSEQSIYLAAEQLLQHLQSADGLNVSPDNVIIFGQSIGGAVAVEMALRSYGRKLILVSPFLSVQAMAKAAFPLVTPGLGLVSWLVQDKFDNGAKAPRVAVPAVVVHGTTDGIVPFSQGARLAELLGCPLVPIEGGGHNDLFGSEYEGAVLDAIAHFAFPDLAGSDAPAD